MNVRGAARFDIRKIRVVPRFAKQIVSLGLPSSFQNSIFAVANLFIQAGVNSFDSVVVEGNSAAANADNLVYDVMAAFYTACSSFMGQNLGAGKKKRVVKSYFISLAYAFGIALVLGICLALFGREFLSLFTKDDAVIAEAMGRLKIMAFSYCVSAFMDNTIAASRAPGKSLVPTIIGISGSCVFRILDIHGFRVLPHAPVALSAVCLLMGDNGDSGDGVFHAHMEKDIIYSCRYRHAERRHDLRGEFLNKYKNTVRRLTGGILMLSM